MGLPVAILARLTDRGLFRRLPVGTAWRLPVTLALLAVVLPVLLTAAVVTLPVFLSVGLCVGLRRLWQRQAGRASHRHGEPR
jgi:hypothetical protein